MKVRHLAGVVLVVITPTPVEERRLNEAHRTRTHPTSTRTSKVTATHTHKPTRLQGHSPTIPHPPSHAAHSKLACILAHERVHGYAASSKDGGGGSRPVLFGASAPICVCARAQYIALSPPRIRTHVRSASERPTLRARTHRWSPTGSVAARSNWWPLTPPSESPMR